jgi:transposase
LADALALPTSRMTLVRLLCTTPAPPAGGRAPRVLGVDEWAFRRGRRYGSILVDLEQHRPVDLLPDATAVGFAAWLKMHPGAAIISRDRGGAFADGARAGAPNAIQVADRFHLLRNLGAVVKRVLQRHASRVQHVPAPPPLSRAPAPGDRASDTTRKRVGGEVTEVSLVARPERADRRASRARTKQTMQEHFEAVQRLAATGMASSAIARVLGLHRHTVQKYRRLSAPPERRHVSRHTSILAPYTGYLLERWRQGCRSAMRLWRELASRGYVGKYRSVARLVADWKRLERAGEAVPPPPPGLTPRQAAGLLLVRPQERTGEEQQAVDRLRTVHAEVAVAMTLFERFAQLIRAGTPRTPAAAAKRLAHLTQWTAEARGSGLAEAAAFVTKLRQDLAAVQAALTLPYSQGQTEGQITRLKALKRQMFGRAGFDLLRTRFLGTPVPAAPT